MYARTVSGKIRHLSIKKSCGRTRPFATEGSRLREEAALVPIAAAVANDVKQEYESGV